MGGSTSQPQQPIASSNESNVHHSTPPSSPRILSAVKSPSTVSIKQVTISTPNHHYNTIHNYVNNNSQGQSDDNQQKQFSRTISNSSHSLNAPADATSTDWWISAFNVIELTSELLLHPPHNITPDDELWLSRFTLDDIMSDAKHMLTMSDTLPMIRYKLVPAKINEYTFWRNLLLHLRVYQTQHQIGHTSLPPQHIRITQSHNTHNNTANNVTNQANGTHTPESTDSLNGSYTSTTDVDTQYLKQTITKLETQLTRITAQYNALNDRYNKLMQSQQSQQRCVQCHQTIGEMHNSSDNTSSNHATCNYHDGDWKLNQQSEEFFSLDESLRNTLRAEKQKRIQQAVKELNWIPDTDKHSDAAGIWSCCNNNTYHSNGCKQAQAHLIIT